MTIRGFVCAGLLAVASMSVASAKVYHITISTTTSVGKSQLKPGDYSVELKGSNAIIKNDENSKSVTVPVKVQTAKTKFNETTMETDKEGDTTWLKTLDLGGSDTQLEF